MDKSIGITPGADNKTARELPQVNPWTAKIRVIALHSTHKAGNIKAFAIITIGGALEIRGCKVIQQAGQKAWVSLPDRKSEDGAGYFPIIRALDPRLMEAISAAVLAAWTASAGGGE